MRPSIDVIVPTFGRPTCAAGLVVSLREQLSSDDRLFVVWQGREKPYVRESPFVRCIYSSPPNLPKARNKGIAEGNGDICLFLDDDVEILSADLLESHRRAHLLEGVGAVAGYIYDPLFDEAQKEPSRFDETTGEIIQNFSLQQSQYTASVMGAHMSFKRKALAGVNGFDEHFKGNALWEEIDCALKLNQAGWKIYYCAEARVRHIREQAGGCREMKEQSPRYLYHLFANTAYFAARYAKRRYFRSWFTFWKYRLEYLSRKKENSLKHDPLLVGAGMLGVCGGVARYVTRRNRKRVIA